MKKGLFLLFILMLVSCSKKPTKVEYGYITFYYGDVSVVHQEKTTKPKLKMILRSDDRVTTGKEGRLDIQLQNFGLIRINENSEVDLKRTITEVNDSVSVSMNNGQVLCKLSKLQKGTEFNITTPTAVAGVRGTTFLVEADEQKGTSEIAVAEGEVEVEDKKFPGKTKTVRGNETAKVSTKSKIISIAKSIDKNKLKELKAIKDTKIFQNLKKVKMNDLKSMSMKNLKNLKINDMKGMGEEFKGIIKTFKGLSKDGSKDSKKSSMQKRTEEAKKKIRKKKKTLKKKQKELEETKKKAEDAVKNIKDKIKF